MKRTVPLVTFAGLLLAGSVAFGQGTGGGGGGGTGAADGRGVSTYNEQNTPGWNAMSQQERSAHQQRMQSFKTYNECRQYMSTMKSPNAGAGGGAGSSKGANTTTSGDPCSHLPRS